MKHSSTAAILRGPTTDRASYGPLHAPDRRVRWGSVTKLFTAALTHVLVDSGHLEWDAPLDDLLGVHVPGEITVRTLVAHQTHLPRVLPEQISITVRDPYGGWTAERFDDDVLPRLEDLIDTEPADPTGYSNLGYALLGHVIEHATDTDWLTALRTHLAPALDLDPAGFESGGPESEADSIVTPGDLFGRRLPEWDLSARPWVAAGGLLTTVPFMAEALAAAHRPDSPLDPRRQPHAWQRPTDGIAWHNGGTAHSGSMALVNLDLGTLGLGHAVHGSGEQAVADAQAALEALVADELKNRQA